MAELIHLSIELSCSILAFIIIVPNLLTFAVYRERFRLWLGMGFLAGGISNLMHALMAHNIGIDSRSTPEFFVPLSGIIPRFVLPVSLAGAIIWDRFFKKSKSPAMEIFTLGPLILITILFISYLIGNIDTSFLLIFREELLKRPQDLVAGLTGFLIIPSVILKREKLWRFLTSGLFLIATSSIVLSFSGELNSPLYISAHIIKLTAFISFAGGVIYDTWQIRNLERERYELYERLKEEKQFSENVLMSIVDGVYTTDTQKNIITWSRGAELITGYKASEVIGRKCSEFLKHRDAKGNVLCETPLCPITQTLEKHRITGPESFDFTTRFGVDRKIDVVVAPVIEKSGDIHYVVEVFRDVTEEKEAQRQLKTAHEKLIKLDELKSNLTHMIIHDMKNPLTAIMSTAELMEYDKNISREEMLENMQIISSESRRLLNMINSLLDIEKIEAGRMELEISPVNIKDIIRNEIALAKTSAKLKNIAIEFVEEGDVPLCSCDQTLSMRVIMNILDNAIKYARSSIRISARAGPDEVTVSIEDDGSGIPEEYHLKIFEKFETVETRVEGKKYSTGLGLTFCKMAVEKMGGRIWVESEPGKGSKFSFTLPVAREFQGGSA